MRGSPSSSSRVRPDRRRGDRARDRIALRRRPAVAGRRVRRQLRRAVAAVARRRQVLGLSALRRLIETASPSIVHLVVERVAVERPVVQGDRERLARHVVAERVERGGHVAGRRDRERDPVAHVQAGRPACVLNGAHQLAVACPSRAEIVGELEVERDGEAAVRRDTPALGHLLDHVDVVGRERDRRAVVDRDGHLLAARERRGHGAVVVRQDGRHPLTRLPSFGPSTL